MILIPFFTPLIFLFDVIRNIINKFYVVEERPQITEQELKFMLQDIKGQGILEDSEGELARSALDLDEIGASEIMTPRVDLVAVKVGDNVETVKNVFLTEKYSRLPVYDGNIDNIVGVLTEKEFFRRYLINKNFKIKDISEKALLIPPQMNISQLMKKFQESNMHMAVVVDQYGGVEGIITFEDVIKQLVGGIYDGKDRSQKRDIVKLDEVTWKVNPDMSVNFMLREVCSEDFLNSEQSSTVGGWILENLGKIPKSGDYFIYKNFKILVVKMQGKRIVEVLIKQISSENF